MRTLWIVLLLPFSFSLAYGQDAAYPAFDLISVDQGLSVYLVSAITQDSSGYLWVGTVGGLNRYDGFGFKTYRHQPRDTASLANNYVNTNALAVDNDGYLWVGTRNGLSRFDPRKETFQTMEGSAGSISSVLVSRTGEIWAGSMQGLLRYGASGQLVSRSASGDLPAADSIFSLVEGPTGAIWAGTTQGVVRIDPDTGKQTSFPISDKKTAWSLHVDRQKRVWIGTDQSTTYRLDPETHTMEEYPVPVEGNGGVPVLIPAFFEEADGTLWLGTYGAGVYFFDPDAAAWTHSSELTEVLGKQVVTSYTDRSGKLWIGTGSGLMHERRTKAFGRLTDGIRHATAVLVAENGDIWVGTRGQGVFTYDADGRIIQQFNTQNGRLLSDHVNTVMQDADGSIWIGTTGGGVTWISPTGEITPFTHDPEDTWSLSNNMVYHIFEDDQQRMWMGTARGGLNLWHRYTGRFASYEPGGEGSISSHEVWTTYQDAEGEIWAGTQEGGLHHVQIHDTGQFPPTIHFEPFRADPNHASSLSSDNVVFIGQEKPNELLLGTMGGGLNVMDIATRTFRPFTEEELPSKSISCALSDKQGGLWISTLNGLVLYKEADSSITSFAVDDGLQSPVFNFNGCDTDASGRLYFAHEAGVTVFNPEDIVLNTTRPKVAITDILLHNDPFLPDTVAGFKRHLVLPHDQNFLSFRFAALDYNAPDKNRYAYMLDGLDAEWIEGLDGRLANYPNLDPGRYTFRVRATNNDGLWSSQDAVMHIRILPPFWARWWFIAFMAGVMSAVVYAVYDVRARQKKREAALRQQISDDLHDDLGSNLGALSYFLDRMVNRNKLRPEDEASAKVYLSSVQRMIGDLDDVVWLVDPGFDQLGSLVSRMQITARSMVQEIELVFTRGRLDEPLSLPMDLRRHLFLAFKEAVHNAVQHSKATTLEVEVNQDDTLLQVTISDNGIGFDRYELEDDGQGLVSLERRGAHPDLSCSVVSRPGFGTTVVLEADI